MYKGIEIGGPHGYGVQFRKEAWADDELFLAKCFSFTVDEKQGTVKADIRKTTKRALSEFMNKCFHSQMFSPDWDTWRAYSLPQIKFMYQQVYEDFYANILPGLEYHDKMYQHQKDSVLLGYWKPHNLFSLEMQMGKSLVAASLTKLHNYSRTLLLCPSIAKFKWYRELTTDWGFDPLHFTVLDSSARRTIRAFREKWVIVNYEMLNKYKKYLLAEKFQHIIIDECTDVKNIHSARAKNVFEICGANEGCRISLLSGTPIQNRLNDLYSYFKLTHHPLGHNYAKFLRDFTETATFRGGIQVKGGKNMDKLSIMLSNFMIRKRKEDCMDLPPKVATKYYFELADYKKQYNDILREMAKQKDISGITSSLHSLNIVVAKSKIKGIINIIDSILVEDRKVIVFTSYTEPLDMLKAHYGEAAIVVDGRINSFQKEANAEAFKKDDKIKVFLGNMKAAGKAINLTNASDVVVVNFPFVPSDLDQATDRPHGIGQTKSVNIFYTICEDSVDEQLYDLIVDKATDINAVIDRQKGAAEYTNIPEQLFRTLIEKFKKENNEQEQSTEIPAEGHGEGDGQLSLDNTGEQETVVDLRESDMGSEEIQHKQL